MFDEITISTIKLSEGRFQTFPDISLSEESLDESRTALGIKHSEEEQALAYSMSCELKLHRLAKMEYCYSGTESL